MHRDIKPGNVIVSDDGTLRLLDFGMALDVAPSGSPEDAEVGGTPAYMAPEQLDLRTTSPASDWYAVGIMLYEVLTGHLPFRGSMQAVLQAKRTADPPPIDGNAPSELAELCRQLLHRDPQLRPAQEEILQVATGQSVSIRGINVAADQQLVGRERQLTELTHAIGNWETTDHAQTIFISGRSGEGKTVLADHFLDRFRKDANFTLLAGRCYDRETLPFKALDTVIDALGSRLRTMPQKKVAKLLTADAAVLAELFPVLNRVEAIAQLPRIRLDSLELQQVRAWQSTPCGKSSASWRGRPSWYALSTICNGGTGTAPKYCWKCFELPHAGCTFPRHISPRRGRSKSLSTGLENGSATGRLHSPV